MGDNKKLAACPATPPAAAPPTSYYGYKDAVLLAASTGSSTVQQPMTIPTAALSAHCNDAPLGFLQKVPARAKVSRSRSLHRALLLLADVHELLPCMNCCPQQCYHVICNAVA